MAYKLETEKIIPGGLNLLAPGDAGVPGDCLILNDWWPGAAGRLEQTLQAVEQNDPSVLDSINSIQKANGHIYYGGSTKLFAIGRDTAGATIDTGYDGVYPLGMLSFQGYCWIMNRTKQRKDDGATVTAWTPAVPLIPTLEDGGVDGSGLTPIADNPPLVGGLANAQFTYYVTWQFAIGESNPSPAATITPAVNGSIVRVHQPASAPANATGWNVYREVGGTPYLLNEDGPLDIARTRCDDYGDEIHTQSDTQMLRLGIIMEADHDAAPAASVMANQIYNDRIVVAASAAHPNRIWYTQSLQPGFFRGSANPFDGDWVDVGTDSGDEILAITARPKMLIIYRARSIWRHIGDFGDSGAILEVIVPDMGIAGPRAAVSTTLGDYFVGNASNPGVYKFNGDWAQKISQKVEPIFRGIGSDQMLGLGLAHQSECAIGFANGRVWVGYPSSTDLFVKSLVYHIETERWFSSTAGYRAFLDAGTALLGGATGVYAIESAYATSPTVPIFHSQYIDCNLPDHEKTWADLVLNHNTQGRTFTIVIRTNKNATSNDSFTLGTFSSSALTKQIFPLVYPGDYAVVELRGKPIRSYNLAVRLNGDGGAAAAVVIETPMLLHYYLEVRRAKSFDTDETEHGMQGTKEVDQVEIDIDATDGAATLQVLSDIPGGVMAVRLGGGQAIPQTAGRQSQKLVLTTPVDGKLLRYTVATATDFQIYGMRARLLPIGVYLDGTVGDFWAPQPISIGV